MLRMFMALNDGIRMRSVDVVIISRGSSCGHPYEDLRAMAQFCSLSACACPRDYFLSSKRYKSETYCEEAIACRVADVVQAAGDDLAEALLVRDFVQELLRIDDEHLLAYPTN